MAWVSICSSNVITSSASSIQARSTSTPVNSVACREVNDGSARKTGADLEDLLDAGRDRHLLVQLRRLGQVGAAAEVAELKDLRSGFRGGAHELGGVHLGGALRVGVLAQPLFQGGLHGEHQLGGGTAAHVEEAPDQPVLDARLLVDRQRGGGRVQDLDGLRNDLQAA
jgi:hypothetical protein